MTLFSPMLAGTSPVVVPFADIEAVFNPDEGALGSFGVIGYQGSKRRYASDIVDHMERRFGKATTWGRFFDLCCGTASVATEVARRAPKLSITVVDAGPWGKFWVEYSRHPAAVQAALQRMLPVTSGRGNACRRLLGKPVGTGATWAAGFLVVTGGSLFARLPGDWQKRWRTTCVLPSASSRGADHIIAGLNKLPKLHAVHGRAEEQTFKAGDVVYVDPDYVGTAGYGGNHCPVPELVTKVLRVRGKMAISHHIPYPGVVGPHVTITAARCMSAGTKEGAAQDCKREILIFPTGVTAK